MYWNNCWLNNFNRSVFFNKILFLENIFFFIFSESIFKNFFEKYLKKEYKPVPNKPLRKEIFFKKFLIKRLKKKSKVLKNKKFLFFKKKKIKKKINKILKYNFSKFFFIKFNKYLLISSFVFFYFKIKAKKKKTKRKFNLNKATIVFWKKRKGSGIGNIKKRIFKNTYKFVF